MKVEIIPAINVRAFEEAKERIKKVEPYIKWCHFDVTDGVFSKHLTWHNPSDLAALETKLNIEVHLMVEQPEKKIDQWLVKPVRRVIVHLEAAKDVDFIISKCREAGVETGLAVGPGTSWEALRPWFGKVDFFAVLAVSPGPSGQKIGRDALDKIARLRRECPGCVIEADGGINPETAEKAAVSGADILVAGSYIFGSEDAKKAIEELKQ